MSKIIIGISGIVLFILIISILLFPFYFNAEIICCEIGGISEANDPSYPTFYKIVVSGSGRITATSHCFFVRGCGLSMMYADNISEELRDALKLEMKYKKLNLERYDSITGMSTIDEEEGMLSASEMLRLFGLMLKRNSMDITNITDTNDVYIRISFMGKTYSIPYNIVTEAGDKSIDKEIFRIISENITMPITFENP